MSYDLRAGLDDLGSAERATLADLPVPELRARARRRRATRMATAGSAALVAAAGIAAAAVALPRLETAPPATTPSWTPDAAGWPLAITLDWPIPRCGEAMPALVRPDVDPTIVIGSTWTAEPMAAGSVLELNGATIAAPSDFPFKATPPIMVLVRDGTVVGTPHPDAQDQSGVWYFETDSEANNTLESHPQPLDLVRCETQGRGAVPLDPGTYDLYLLQDVLPQGAPIDDPAISRTIAAGPFPVIVEAP